MASWKKSFLLRLNASKRVSEKNSNTKNQAGIKLNTWLLPILTGIFLLLYLLSSYRGWLIFFIGSLSVWLLALVWVISLRGKLYIERKLHLAWATVGDSVHEELRLINAGLIPAVWVEIVDTSENQSTSLGMVSDVSSNSSRIRHFSYLCRQRGFYTLGPTRIRTSDPFGIYSLTMRDYHSDQILVTPPLLTMNQLRITPAGWAGDYQKRHGALERKISDSGVRNYLPGDSLKRIHWPASAHFDHLMVRLLEASSSGDWWIFVDLDERVQIGKDIDSTLELSIVIAASLAMIGLKDHRHVGLAMAGPDLVWLEPRGDLAHPRRILKALAMATPGDYSLAELIKVKPPTRTATMIVITSTVDPSWIAAAGLQGRAGRVALLVDPMEYGGTQSQDKLRTALTNSSIPYYQMPRSLLREAYAPVIEGLKDRGRRVKIGERYLKQGESSWLNLTGKSTM